MKVAIVFPPTSGFGGIETATSHVVRGLQSAGETVRVFGLAESCTDNSWHQDLPWTYISHLQLTGISHRQTLTFAWRLAAELRQFRPHVIVTLDTDSILIARLACLFSGHRAPIASWLHFTLKTIGRKFLLPVADCHIAISHGGARELRSVVGESAPVFVVHNGTQMDVPSIPRPNAAAPVQFIYVGRMQVGLQKRVDDILLAASELSGKFHLTLVGAGDGLAQLQRMGRELGLGNKVTWIGWQSHPWKSITEAHTLLLSSSYEGFGMVLVEAMSRGVPCISTDCEVGPADIINPGINGWLYPVGDIARLRTLMQSVIDHPSALPPTTAVIDSINAFSIEENARKFREALLSAVRSGPRCLPKSLSSASFARNLVQKLTTGSYNLNRSA